MAPQKDVFGFVDAGREIRRPPLVGMQFLHERAVRATDVGGARTGIQTGDPATTPFQRLQRARQVRHRGYAEVLDGAGGGRGFCPVVR